MTRTTKTFHFATSRGAWTFMRECDALGLSAGYPALDATNAVSVSVKSADDAAKLARTGAVAHDE